MALFRATLAAAALALIPGPVLAQDDANGLAGFGEAMAGMFAPPPPLTEQEQARLPLAMALAEKVVPAGSLGGMMDGMMGGLFGAVLGTEGEPSPRSVISRRVGVFSVDTGAITDQQALRIADLLDPAWRERETRSRAFTQAAMNRVMQAVEPVVRQAIAELYAIHFTQAQLADIDAFFATPSGAAYASQSYQMASDPRLMGTMMRMMPEAMGQMGSIQAELDAALADLPPQRNYADLTTNQRKLLAQWLGVPGQDLEYALMDATGPVAE